MPILLKDKSLVYGKESQIQKSINDFLTIKDAFWYHTPNGGTRNIVEAVELKRMGVKPGVLDCCFPAARRGYHGAYVEVKTKTGRLSPHQLGFMSKLEKENYYSCVVRNIDEMIEFYDWYF